MCFPIILFSQLKLQQSTIGLLTTNSHLNVVKALHIFSMAGVAEILCKYGAGDKVLQLDQLDSFGFAEFYGVTERFKSLQELVKRAEELEPDYDKIIIHDYSEFRQYFPSEKIVFIFHGTKLRQMHEIERAAVQTYPCFVTTPDLMEYLPNAVYLPAPVDLEHFTLTKFEPATSNLWICINRSYQRDYIEKSIKDKYPEIEYYERNSKNTIDYSDMPHFLEQYDHYVDWKFTYDKPEPITVPVLSTTGLQAMAVGCTVHDSNGTVNDPILLTIHNARLVAQRFVNEIG